MLLCVYFKLQVNIYHTILTKKKCLVVCPTETTGIYILAVNVGINV